MLTPSRAALLLLFSFEALVFYAQLAEQITPYFPRGYDQLSYFVATYRLLHRFFGEGWIAFWHHLREGQTATGATFPVQGAAMALLGGANRTAMVSLNLVYFIAAQIMVFFTVWKRTGQTPYAWMAIALMLALHGLFNLNGGMYDYRIDFAAMCLYGIWLCALLNTSGMRDLRWAVIAALIGAALVAMRFITIAYVAPVLLALLAFFLVRYWRGKADAARQTLNAFVCGALTFAITGPLLYFARHALYAYYGVGHLLGVEKGIRAREVGIASVLEHLAYYPNNIWTFQLGKAFLVIAAALLVLGALRRAPRLAESLARYRSDFAVLALALVAPLLVLTLGEAKSPVVGGIVSLPAVLAIVLGAAALQDRHAGNRIPAAIMLTLAAFAFVTRATAAQHHLSKADLGTIERLNVAIARYVEENNIITPRVSFDQVTEFLGPGTVWLHGLQRMDVRHPRPLHSLQALGGIFAASREEIVKALEVSDVLVLTHRDFGREKPWPFNDSMRQHWPVLEGYAKQHLRVLEAGMIEGIPYQVFVRPTSRARNGPRDASP